MPINTGVLRKYPNNIFIETGSYLGHGIRIALKVGFEKIYSIEIDRNKFKKLSIMFEKIPSVILVCGDSREKLGEVLDKVNQSATIWLDAHDRESSKRDSGCPILDELHAISKHCIKTHTILIDDFRLFNRPTGFWGTKPEIIREYLLKINVKYKISFEDGHVEKDIMVAKL